MTEYIEYLVGLPTLDPNEVFISILSRGSIVNQTNEKIVFADDDGNKVVFTGSFSTGTEITGAMTGFKVKVDGQTVKEGGGFAINAPALMAALEADFPQNTIRDLLYTEKPLIRGSDDADILNYNGYDLKILGQDGDDQIIGGFGDQTLKGNQGDDLLVGYKGFDKLKGGVGLDTFAFELASFAGGGAPHHRIKDFTPGDDNILLNWNASDLDDGVLNGSAFRVGEQATSADHRIIYHQDSGALYFDRDGVGGEYDQIQFAKVDPGTTINADDIVIGPLPFFG